MEWGNRICINNYSKTMPLNYTSSISTLTMIGYSTLLAHVLSSTFTKVAVETTSNIPSSKFPQYLRKRNSALRWIFISVLSIASCRTCLVDLILVRVICDYQSVRPIDREQLCVRRGNLRLTGTVRHLTHTL